MGKSNAYSACLHKPNLHWKEKSHSFSSTKMNENQEKEKDLRLCKGIEGTYSEINIKVANEV